MSMYNPFSLEGKTILITGASSGIGRAIAIECSNMGAQLVITGRNKERLCKTYNLLSGSNHMQIIADLSVYNALAKLVEEVPVLDGCVNNAGIAKPLLVQFINQDVLSEIMQINTFAPILLSHLLLKKKKIKRGASLVFTSSVSGVYCSSIGGSLYAASKGAIHGFIKGTALDVASKGIRVNSVNPGMIHTELFSDGTITEEQLQEDMKKYPLKRYGKPEEVAYAVIYLLSDASKWVTGSSLLIDGGYTLQ